MVDFGKTLGLVAQEMKIGFTLHDKTIAIDSVFADTGLLPAFLRRADQLCNFCMGYGLGLTFDPAENSQLGIKVVFNNEVPNVLRLMCAVEILFELAEAARNRTSIPLDDLMYD
jgi:intracellular multiplication protein IcmS